ncbi:hypothetical protein D3C73_1038330 [compost metagenome]
MTQQPVMDLCPVLAHADHTAASERAGHPLTGLIQHGNRRHRIMIALANPAIHHHTGTALLPAPRLIGDQRILEQAFRTGDTAHMTFGFFQPVFAERAALGMGFDVISQATDIRLDVVLVLAEELYDPGVFVMFVKRILQGVFHRVAHLLQAIVSASFGRYRRDVKNSPDGHSVIEQNALFAVEKLSPGQVINDGRIGVIHLLLVFYRHLAWTS